MATTRTPWHLWLVGIIGLAWNSFGVFDYSMTQIRGEQHLRAFGMTDAQIAYMDAMPAWMTGVWAIGVWGAMLGTILLLLRRRLAAPVFAMSLAGFVMSLIYNYLLSDGAKIMPESGNIMNLVILAGCLFFLLYARAMAKSGVLR